MADDYSVTHKGNFRQYGYSSRKGQSGNSGLRKVGSIWTDRFESWIIHPLRNQISQFVRNRRVHACFYYHYEGLTRKWRHPERSAGKLHQVEVTLVFCDEFGPQCSYGWSFWALAETNLVNFFWPSLHQDVSHFCKMCHACQVLGNPNLKISSSPLKQIRAFEELGYY